MLPSLLTPRRAEAWRRARPAATPDSEVQQPDTSPDYLRVALYVLAAVLLALLGPVLHRAAQRAQLPATSTPTTAPLMSRGPSTDFYVE